jgi:predicted transposase/invertase (TIGR01784 family)
VDCVFRALLADPEHADRLIDFLNAVLQRPSPVARVQLRNPIQPAEFIDDGHIVVDVVATDASGEVFQVEMQSWNQAALKERMLYAWGTLYKGQLERGDPYTDLRPVVSIWLLDHNTFREAAGFHHRFRVRDDAGRLELSSHLEIHVLELDRWRESPDLSAPVGLVGWMRFFTEAETWTDVPSDIDTPALESAMSVLNDFQTNAARNDLYRSRLDYLRTQNTMAGSLEQALAEKDQALAEKDQALAEKDQALAEKDQALAEKDQALAEKDQALAEKEQVIARAARLRERLRAAGVDPDME